MKQSAKDKAQGKSHEVKGTVKEKVGRATNSPDPEAERQVEELREKAEEIRGKVDKIRAKVQKTIGQVEKVRRT
jgi:uncharacterized protein YjbJ (UPF0337 family)